MLSTGFRPLPDNLHEPKNLSKFSEACERLAIEKKVAADLLDEKAADVEAGLKKPAVKGDTIHANVVSDKTPRELRHEARYLRGEADKLYTRAQAYHKQSHDQKTKWQKARPYVYNSIIVTVVLAEIISIPILLANIYMMVKHGDKHNPLPQAGSPLHSNGMVLAYS